MVPPKHSKKKTASDCSEPLKPKVFGVTRFLTYGPFLTRSVQGIFKVLSKVFENKKLFVQKWSHLNIPRRKLRWIVKPPKPKVLVIISELAEILPYTEKTIFPFLITLNGI